MKGAVTAVLMSFFSLVMLFSMMYMVTFWFYDWGFTPLMHSIFIAMGMSMWGGLAIAIAIYFAQNSP